MTEDWTPELRLRATDEGCLLTLAGVTYGNGATLQAASNDLMARLFDVATAIRSGRYRLSSELGAPQPDVLAFLWEVGDLAAHGGDIRARVLGGVPTQRASAD